MANQDFKITSYDTDAIKSSLVAFLKTKPELEDFDYEGSAINTIIDLLTRNTHYMAFLANMTANESFLDTAQVRSSVVSHAQKLSYTPKSRTASTSNVRLKVKPASPSSKTNITLSKGSVFVSNIDGVSYSFTNTESSILIKDLAGDFITPSDVVLKQGQLVSNRYVYAGQPIVIQNKNIDSSTIKMYIKTDVSADNVEFLEVDDITQTKIGDEVYFLSENTSGNYQIEFGKNVLGLEPVIGSIITVEYVVVPDNHANGLGTFISGSTIEGFSNIEVSVTIPAFGGSERDDIERIRFLAPRIHKAQNRAVVESDFTAIVLRDFPFIKSAICWGGEKNSPPYFGRTFLSLIPVDGYNIVNSVKRAIEARLQKYTISTTPFVVDANYLYLDLDIDYIFDDTQTSDTEQALEATIAATVNSFNEGYLKQFDFWYNESKLNNMLTDIKGVESVEVKTKAYYELNIVRGASTKYQIEFVNEIRPGTFKLSGYVADISATNDYIEDDGEGNLVRRFNKNSMSNKVNIGTIDYDTGSIELTVQFLTGTPDMLKAFVEPLNDNFYTNNNYVVAINSISPRRITNRRV